MFCIHCGTELPKHAKFCYQCGKQVEVMNNQEKLLPEVIIPPSGQVDMCEIVYVPVQEKIGLFPKEKGRFEAIAVSETEKKMIAASPVFELGGLSLYGPQEKNALHKQPLEALANTLKAEGWVQQKKPGAIWYNLRFERNS